MILEILSAVLMVSGLLLILWCMFGMLLLPMGDKMSVQYSATQDAVEMEQSIRCFVWLRETGVLRTDLTIIDRGLSEDGIIRAQEMVNRYNFVHILTDPPIVEDRTGGK